MLLVLMLQALSAAEHFKFDFGAATAADGHVPVMPATIYSEERGYGFEPDSTVEAVERGGLDGLRKNFITGAGPFLFSVAVPEGNYNVTILFGDAKGASTNTVKAESRRLMLPDVRTQPGEFATRTCTVNVRAPGISTGGAVRLKEREKACLHWDNKLTIEFNGARPCIAALEIERVTNAITVFLAGDSTVTDQPGEPWNSWGQMLTRFFKPGVAIANHAESGESLKSSLGARRFDKIFSAMRPGDYLFLQFGHNDMKDPASNALSSYQASLERLVDETRRRGATPVLVTSMERKAGVEHDTLGEYPDTVRAVAKARTVALIELNAMSKVLYRALGTNLDSAFHDGSHHNAYGSYELARCVVQQIRDNKPDLARWVLADVTAFHPSRPDSIETVRVPASPLVDATKPDGN